MPDRRIYLLSPKQLSPETIAVTFAKTSRSPETFQEIAAELSEEKSARFHEKWVVGYGHASVAEHAVLHIAIENVSRLAVESIESNRLASYTEKSTRYQKWDTDLFHIPAELDGSGLRQEYTQTCQLLFETYVLTLAPVRALVENQNPRREGENDEAYDRRIRSQYVDSCRFLLPAASLANLGMTGNARVLEHAISKMLSHPLMEVRQIGEEVKRVARAEVPTLVKYADSLPYLVETSQALAEEGKPLGQEACQDWCRLVEYDPEGENKILAAALYRYGQMSFETAHRHVAGLDLAGRERLAEQVLGRLGEHDSPVRELEYTSYLFDLVLDQGGYAEFKRHRMMTQSPQRLTWELGYTTPRRIVEAGCEAPYRAALERAGACAKILAEENPELAAYVIPNGYNRRILFRMNLREAFAFCSLRSAANAHFSMRRAAERIAEQIGQVHPLLVKYMHLPKECWQDVETDWFNQV